MKIIVFFLFVSIFPFWGPRQVHLVAGFALLALAGADAGALAAVAALASDAGGSVLLDFSAVGAPALSSGLTTFVLKKCEPSLHYEM